MCADDDSAGHDVVDEAFPSKVAAVVRGEVAHLPVTIATTDEAIAELVEALRKAHDKTYEK